jgi:tRNA(Ile)-lysidine synthase
MGPGPAVAAVRHAVRACLRDLTAGDLVLVACSGGADSLALAAAAAFTAPRLGLRAGGVTVDHRLQPGSGERAAGVAVLLGQLGLDPVRNVAVTVAPAGPAGGPEAAARAARYHALDAAAAECRAAAVLLGHTLDDQAETVLLGLARGSGGRSLAGMPARRGSYRRPLLAVRRSVTSAACAELGLEPWHDPHNADARFARARVRHQALPALEAALGPGVAEALARTASQLRTDAECLDDLAFACLDDLAFAEGGKLRAEGGQLPGEGPDRDGPDGEGPDGEGPDGGGRGGEGPGGDGPGQAGLAAAWLQARPAAIRTRILRDAAVMAGCPPGALGAAHIDAIDALVTGWRGQRWVDLPGGVRARRRDGKVWFTSKEGGESVGRERHGA